MVSSAYLRLLIFFLAILISACTSSSQHFAWFNSAKELNKQGDNIQSLHTPSSIWNQSVVPCRILTVASWPTYRFLRRQERWSGISISLGAFHRRRQWCPTPVLLPGKFHGWRSLVGCSPWGREESDTTEWLHFHFSLSCIGEGNGYPLQCSCLENPRDRGAWWAAIYGVAQREAT